MPNHDKIIAIVNPCAAHGAAKKHWLHILKYLKTQDFEVTTYITRRKLHASRIAHESVKNGAQHIISVGGDGTFNEIINGLLNYTTEPDDLPELAMIPMGTGSDLPRTLGIPVDYKAAIEILKNGRTVLIDVGKAVFKMRTKKWERYFANVFDVGIGGNVIRIANRIPKNLGGFLTFLISSLTALLSFRRVKVNIWVDKILLDSGLFTIIGAANGQFFGGGMHIAPMALINDGFLEILHVKDTNLFKFIANVLAKVYKAKHLEYHNVFHCRGEELRIQCMKVCLMDIDGEEERAQEVTVSVIPRAIKIRVQ